METFRKKVFRESVSGSLITDFRRKNNLSIQELADRLGVTLYCLWSWEKEKHAPRKNNLKKLSEIGIFPEDKDNRKERSFFIGGRG